VAQNFDIRGSYTLHPFHPNVHGDGPDGAPFMAADASSVDVSLHDVDFVAHGVRHRPSKVAAPGARLLAPGC